MPNLASGEGAAAVTPSATALLPERSLSTLIALADAFLPSLPPPDSDESASSSSDDNEQALRRFWSHSLDRDSSPAYVDAIATAVRTKLAPPEGTKLQSLLYVLSFPLGASLALCHPHGLLVGMGLHQWTLDDRVWALQRWRDSPLVTHREIFAGLKRLLCGIAMSYVHVGGEEKEGGGGTSEVGPQHLNPYWEAMGYPGPIHRTLPEEEDRKLMDEGNPYDFEEEGALLHIAEDSVLQFDVVVVGSGSGGGVAAATLAGAGYSVLVVEKGSYVPPEERNNLECDMFDRMYEQHSLLTTTDGNVMILAGSTLGGGSTVNWACCLDTPMHVRKEWADQAGLEQFRPSSNDAGDRKTDFDQSLETVKERIGCNSSDTKPVHHNRMNEKFIRGCNALGHTWTATGQNLKHTGRDSAGYTCFGDRYGNKQGGLVTYLHDAAKAGAKVLTDCTVEEILYKGNACHTKQANAKSPFKNSGAARMDGRGRAYGVIGRVGDHKVHVLAKRCVILCAGSLNTPCVLMRSRFRNWHIGRHLHLHPVTCAVGLYDAQSDDGSASNKAKANSPGGTIRGWLGAPMTVVCNAFEQGPSNNGYGAKLECPSVHSGLSGAGLPWKNPVDFKSLLLRAKDAATIIILQRDKSEGQVKLSRDKIHPRVDYILQEDDKRSMLHSLRGAISVLAASGAKYLLTGHNDDKGLHVQGKNITECTENDSGEEPLSSYASSIESRGMPKHRMSVFSAHQMGSCRMGTSPKDSAVDENGECWECDDLFVLDASIFPTASAANPMLTTLAMSHMLSSRIALRLQFEDGELRSNADATEKAKHLLRDRDEKRSRGAASIVPSFLKSPWIAVFLVTGSAAVALSKYNAGKWL